MLSCLSNYPEPLIPPPTIGLIPLNVVKIPQFTAKPSNGFVPMNLTVTKICWRVKVFF